MGIEDSSSSLEVLIATRYMHRECNGGHITLSKQIQICQSFNFTSVEGDKPMSTSFRAKTWGLRLLAHH